MSLNSHRFAAIRGHQSGGEYYTVICEMNLIKWNEMWTANGKNCEMVSDEVFFPISITNKDLRLKFPDY